MSDKIRTISPVDGSVYVERTAVSPSIAKSLVEKAHIAGREWAKRPLSERIDLVTSAIAKLGDMNPEIVVELARQMGRPVRYKGEFGGVNERTAYMAQIAPQSLAPQIIENSDRFIRKITFEAAGVVLIIAPWNYPFLTTINTLVPALIAGNAVLIKSASQTLLAGERLAKACHDAGIPNDLVVPIVLNHDTTGELIKAGLFDFINFTGSTAAGRQIEHMAAGTFTKIGLELGGKDPGYVCDDADLEVAAETLIDGAMYNSGQCCCGIERIYVNENLYDRFVEKAVAITSAYKLGNPLDNDTTLGPMANKRFATVVREQTAGAVRQGAKTLINPKLFPQDDGGAYLMPQILTNVNHQMQIMREESFGPVVGIMKVKNDQEAIALMNDCLYGLTSSIWTRDSDRADFIGQQLQTGTVFMNRCDYLDPALCWTGCKDTGRGIALSSLGYQSLTRVKSYHLRKQF